MDCVFSCMKMLIVWFLSNCQVEKQKILQASGGRSEILNKPEIKKTNQDLARKTSSESQRNPFTFKPPPVTVGIATTSKANSSEVKKPSRSAVSFFDRYLDDLCVLN